jgi:hypothetical protein
MIRTRVSVLSAISAIAVSAAAVAQAPPSGPPVNRPPSTLSVKPPTQQLGNATVSNPAADVAQFRDNARNRSAMLTCQGPLPLEIKAKDTRDASKGVYFLLSFKEATAATDVKPGECWRAGGYTFGSGSTQTSLNRGLKKGDILYDPPVIKCPAISSMKIENGKVTGVFNETLYSPSMFYAASNPGQHVFLTKWLNFNDSTGQPSGWGHYIAVSADEVLAASPAVPGCRG